VALVAGEQDDMASLDVHQADPILSVGSEHLEGSRLKVFAANRAMTPSAIASLAEPSTTYSRLPR
jgi:hypothetical protein